MKIFLYVEALDDNLMDYHLRYFFSIYELSRGNSQGSVV